jgi:hypothetical protein
MEDPRKCATCRKYWESVKQCRSKAPAPIPQSHNQQVQQTTMWLEVDGTGCNEWEPRPNEKHTPDED